MNSTDCIFWSCLILQYTYKPDPSKPDSSSYYVLTDEWGTRYAHQGVEEGLPEGECGGMPGRMEGRKGGVLSSAPSPALPADSFELLRRAWRGAACGHCMADPQPPPAPAHLVCRRGGVGGVHGWCGAAPR